MIRNASPNKKLKISSVAKMNSLIKIIVNVVIVTIGTVSLQLYSCAKRNKSQGKFRRCAEPLRHHMIISK